MKCETQLRPCFGEEDWTQTRECYIRALHSYPLYTYMIPDEAKRPEFLRRYLDAIYDVSVRKGNSIILCLEVNKKTDKERYSETDNGRSNGANCSSGKQIIGALWLVPPLKTGGWECSKNQCFMESYEEFKLEEFDPESFQRMLKYEDWEYENITKHVFATGIPMWNGAFGAMDPAYTGQGHGTLVGPKCLMFLEQFTTALQKTPQKQAELRENRCLKIQRCSSKSNPNIKSDTETECISTAGPKNKTEVCRQKFDYNCNKGQAMNLQAQSRFPIIFALSHNPRSVNFYKKNGFFSATELCFSTNGNNDSDFICSKVEDFNVHVLLLDPFKTGKSDQVTESLTKTRISSDLPHKSPIPQIANIG